MSEKLNYTKTMGARRRTTKVSLILLGCAVFFILGWLVGRPGKIEDTEQESYAAVQQPDAVVRSEPLPLPGLSRHALLALSKMSARSSGARLNMILGHICFLDYEDCKILFEEIEKEHLWSKLNVMGALLGRMAEFDGAATADYIVNAKGFAPHRQVYFLQNIIENWRDSPEEIFDWWKTTKAKRSSLGWSTKQHGMTLTRVFERWTNQESMESAIARLERLAPGELTDSERSTAVNAIVATRVPHEEFEITLRNIRLIGDADIRSDAEKSLALFGSSGYPLGRLEKLQKVGLFGEYGDEVLERWLSRQPASAGPYLLATSKDPPSAIIKQVVSRWAYRDPFAAAGWISELTKKVDSPSDLDSGLAVVAVALARNGSTGIAVEQAEKITQADLRQRALKNVIFEVHRKDRASARALLDNDSISPDTRAEIQKIYLE